MRLVILDDYDKASEWAAKYVRNRIQEFNPGPDRHFVLGLPTGTSRDLAVIFPSNLWISTNFDTC